MYMGKVGEIYKLFHPETKSGKGAGTGQRSASKEELIREAKRRGIKLPRRGL